MRKRERERFQRLNFTEEDLEIRDSLYKDIGCQKNTAMYKIIITEENNKRKHAGYNYGYLAYFSDYPEDGTYIDTIYFSFPYQFDNIIKLYEGEFYQLFDNVTGKRIGYGNFDPDSPVEEIRGTVNECCLVCRFCFWHGMLYNEENGVGEYRCYRRENKL